MGLRWLTPGQDRAIQEALSASSEAEEPNTDRNSVIGAVSPEDRSFFGTQALVFGYSPTEDALHSFYPSQSQCFGIMLAYEENCDPVVKVTHRPTIKRIFLKVINRLHQLSPAEEALFFAICYGAICSLDERQCQEQLSGEQKRLKASFRLAVEQALSKAHFMESPTLVNLQAFVLYLVFLRSQDDMRMVWPLAGMATNLARSLGIHRDGTKLDLKPYDIEMRRRLWWQIEVLESRFTEDQGVESSLDHPYYDTKLPLNINDEDISEHTTQLPKEREGTTEMTFCLIRYELCRAARHFNHPSGDSRVAEAGQIPAKHLADTEEWITNTQQHLQARYLRHCDVAVP